MAQFKRVTKVLLGSEFYFDVVHLCYGQYCAMGLGWVGLDFRGLLPSLFEE